MGERKTSPFDVLEELRGNHERRGMTREFGGSLESETRILVDDFGIRNERESERARKCIGDGTRIAALISTTSCDLLIRRHPTTHPQTMGRSLDLLSPARNPFPVSNFPPPP